MPMSAYFRSIRFTDLIDILIISVFIYLILVWLKKARARSMFIGMAAIALIYIVARALSLYLTTMALQAFFAVALIMVVIIFQDDLRHFFERVAIIGVTRKRRAAASSEQSVDILVSALANLSRKKIGALVVVRGRDPLDRHLEAGIDVDALLSQVLLESIFDPHVPSHDGAVIVEGSRITKLGCHLPLSINMSEAGRFGTRHAAALGITEHADALALVVSEEHGTISVAEDGRMRHPKEMAQLQHVLREFYRQRFPEAKSGAGLAGIIMRHLPEKVFAVLLAASLWMTFGHRTEMVRRDVPVPIEYRSLAPDRIIKEPKIKEVTVTLSGTEQEFNLLKTKEIKLSLDTSVMQDGENVFTLTKDLVRGSKGFSVVNVDPNVIVLNSYRMVPVDIPVTLTTTGKPSPDITIREMRLDPRIVPAFFPSDLPKARAVITMEAVDLSSINGPTTVAAKLRIAPEIRFPDDKPPEVRVSIEAEKKPEPVKAEAADETTAP